MIIFGLETLVVYFIMVFKLNIELLQIKFEKHQVLMKTRLIWARAKYSPPPQKKTTDCKKWRNCLLWNLQLLLSVSALVLLRFVWQNTPANELCDGSWWENLPHKPNDLNICREERNNFWKLSSDFHTRAPPTTIITT